MTDSKALALEFLATLQRQDFDAWREQMSEDATWTMMAPSIDPPPLQGRDAIVAFFRAGDQVFLAVGVIFLILMHSGKDAGLSGAFGVGTGAGPFGGGSLVERNLNRWTVGFAALFIINTIVLLKI